MKRSISRAMRFAILERDGFRCGYCKAEDVPLEVDHINPRALSGRNDPSNLITACQDCNAGKSATPLGKAGQWADAPEFPVATHVRLEKVENGRRVMFSTTDGGVVTVIMPPLVARALSRGLLGTPINKVDQRAVTPDANLNREAAKWRTRLREAEAERDALQHVLDTLRRRRVNTIARKQGISAEALWAVGIDLNNLLDDDGVWVDPSKVNDAVRQVKSQFGLVV